jgi:hypothetical protein
MLPAVDLGGRVWLGDKPCKRDPHPHHHDCRPATPHRLLAQSREAGVHKLGQLGTRGPALAITASARRWSVVSLALGILPADLELYVYVDSLNDD